MGGCGCECVCGLERMYGVGRKCEGGGDEGKGKRCGRSEMGGSATAGARYLCMF